MKTATVWSRSPMCCCKVWFLHNEIIAPDVSINMLCICCLIGKGFLVELQAEGVLTEEQGCLWGQHFEEKVLKRRFWRGRVKWKWDVERWQDTDSLNRRSSGKHAFKLYMYFRYIFGVCKKWRGVMNSKFENPAWMASMFQSLNCYCPSEFAEIAALNFIANRFFYFLGKFDSSLYCTYDHDGFLKYFFPLFSFDLLLW